jgi:hypothetical protein
MGNDYIDVTYPLFLIFANIERRIAIFRRSFDLNQILRRLGSPDGCVKILFLDQELCQCA